LVNVFSQYWHCSARGATDVLLASTIDGFSRRSGRLTVSLLTVAVVDSMLPVANGTKYQPTISDIVETFISRLPTTQLRPHNRCTGQSPLASHPGAHSVQGRSPRVQSASWTRATVSRTTDQRLQLTWLTCTPFGQHESPGHTICSNVDCRRPGIQRC